MNTVSKQKGRIMRKIPGWLEGLFLSLMAAGMGLLLCVISIRFWLILIAIILIAKL